METFPQHYPSSSILQNTKRKRDGQKEKAKSEKK